MEPQVSRRSLGAQGLRLLLLGALLRHASAARALTGSIGWSARPWLRALDEAATALATGQVGGRAWQSEVERVLGSIELPDLLRSLDFEALAAAARFPSEGEGMQRLYFPDAEGRLQPLRFRPYLFTLQRGTAVVPHGHHNMATLHLVLSGAARVRHFDKLAATDTHMLIRGQSDRLARPGDVSSISDEGANIHWFQAQSERVFMFNIGVYQVDPGRPFGERDYLDPLGGTDAGNGVIRAARLDRAAAHRIYGHT